MPRKKAAPCPPHHWVLGGVVSADPKDYRVDRAARCKKCGLAGTVKEREYVDFDKAEREREETP